MRLFLALLTLTALSACTARGSIGPDYRHGGNDKFNSSFCPPGQAKKGRC